MSLEPIAVLGGGDGAHAMAADLTLAGLEVRLCEHPDVAGGFQTTLDSGVIHLEGIGRTGDARPALVTTDFSAALDGARLVNVVIPAFGHDLFFDAMTPHLKEPQVVIVWAGDFGSLKLAHTIARRPGAARPGIMEASTLPYGARRTEPNRVAVLLEANRFLVAALPASDTDRWMGDLQAIYPAARKGDHVLQVAFSNPNPLVHPPGSLMGVPRIEYTGGDYYLYREGMTPAPRRVIKRMFDEANAVGSRLGFTIPGFPEEDFDKPASIMGEVFGCGTKGDKYEIIANIRGPTSLESRYITEDLPYGLLPIVQLGDRLGVDTPTIDAIIQLGTIVCETDFWSEGRDLDSLGLAELDADRIIPYVTGVN